MSHFTGNLDYIFFLSGFSLLLFAALCFFLRREKPGQLAWRWLGFFALTAGAGKWLALLAYSFRDGHAFAWGRLALMAASYGLLLEYARRSAADAGLKTPSARWYALPAGLALACAWYGFSGVNAAVRYGAGLAAGAAAAWITLRAARPLPRQLRRPLYGIGALLGLYALAAGGVTPYTGLQPSSWLNYEWFWNIFGFPAQALEAAAAALLAGSGWLLASTLWLYSRSLFLSDEPGGEDASWKLRWVPLAVLAAVLAAGWYGVSELGRAERLAVVRDGRNNTSILYFRLNEKLLGLGQTVAVMSDSQVMAQALKTKSKADLDKANALLDRYAKVHDIDVCYLMDAAGNTVAASNRMTPGSFVGDNYAFRPYFKDAVQGRGSRYFALGNTSKTRGYYAGAPVSAPGGKVLGVGVIKKNLDALEAEMRLMPYAFFASPEGVVFLSGRPEFLFSSLWTVSPEARYELLKSNQFGPLEFEPLWAAAPQDGELVYLKGEEYYLSRLMIGGDGWSLVSLSPTRTVLGTRFYGVFITLVLCLLAVGLLVILAQYQTRRTGELELIRVREEKRVLAGLLPVCAGCRKPRTDREYLSQVDSYMAAHQKVSSAQCLCPDCASKVYSPGRDQA